MGILDTVNDLLQPGAGEDFGRRAANTLLGSLGANTVPISQNIEDIYGYFLATLLQSANSVPLKPLWICFIDTLPDTTRRAEAFDRHGAGSHALSLYHSAARSNIDMRGATAALLAQEVQAPGDEYDMSRGDINMGGYLNGAVGSKRKEFDKAKIAYLETNYSFTDFVLRPWSIDTSYRSLKFSPRANITMINFAKAGKKSQFVPRKIITLHNCCPVSIDTESYTYQGTDVTIRQVEWHYDSYTMQSGQIIQERDLLSTLDRVLNIGDGINPATIVNSGIQAATGLFSNLVTNIAGDLGSEIEERANDLLGRSNNQNDSIGSVGVGGSIIGTNAADTVQGVSQTNRNINNSDTVISSQIDSINRTPGPDTVETGTVNGDVLINPDDTPDSNAINDNIQEVNPTLQDIINNQVSAAKRIAKTAPDGSDFSSDTPTNIKLAPDDVVLPAEDVASANRLQVAPDQKINQNDIFTPVQTFADDVITPADNRASFSTAKDDVQISSSDSRETFSTASDDVIINENDTRERN